MNRQVEDTVATERQRIESFALAANPSTSPEFIKALFSARQEEVEPEELEEDWTTPVDPSEIEAFLNASA